MPIEIPIRCLDCDARGSVQRVTAGLQCRCGSNNIDIDELNDDGTGPMADSTEQGMPKGKKLTTDTVSGTQPEKTDYPKAKPPKEGRHRRASTEHTAYPHGYGTGWNKPMPDPTRGWSEYEAKPADPNPVKTPQVADPGPCPTCHGSGYDMIDKGPCRLCGGTGHHLPPTGPPAQEYWDATNPPYVPGSARWASSHTARQVEHPTGQPASRKPSAATQAPQPAVRRPSPSPKAVTPPAAPSGGSTGEARAPLTLPHRIAAVCPVCKAPSTVLKLAANDHTWWACKCGSLTDLDVGPGVDPFDPGSRFVADRHMKRASKMRRNVHDGRIAQYLHTITAHNDLSPREAVTLARNTHAKYGSR